MPSWTPEQKQLLRDNWHARTALEIGAMLTPPVTRNAVIGQACRMGLVPKRTGPPRVSPARIAARTRTTPFKPKPPTSTPSHKAPPTSPESLPPPNTFEHIIPRAQLRRLEQLEPHHCRWPIDNPDPNPVFSFFFCGADAPTQPYCAYHTCVAFRPGAPRFA